jgi:colanic acid/amylovoran biosynthesis glycosyltransferase
LPSSDPRVAYVVKVYPRFSETFIVNELLAHERAGLDLEVVSLRPPGDGRLHPATGRVRAPISYLPAAGLRAEELWTELAALAAQGAGALDELARAAPGASARDVHQGLLLARIVRDRGIDLLHAHFASAATTVARIAAALTGVPFTLTAHAKDIFHDSVDPAVLGPNLTAARAVVTVSDFNAAHLRRLAPRAAVRRVYNGLHLPAFAFGDPQQRPPHVVAVGRLVEKKGFADLVDACALLRDRGVRFSCSIAGDGPLRPDLERRIAARGVGDRVRLLGPLAQDEVRALVAGAAAFAAPCVVAADGNRDGLPTVLLEAMALGTPCVSTPVTGIPEAVRDGETGLLVPEHDPGALASALERLCRDAALRSRLARAARALVERSFDVDRSAAELRELWAPAAAGDAPPALAVGSAA